MKLSTIEDAIGQRAFQDIRVKTMINIMHTASCISVDKSRVLRPLGLSTQQFNVLRILRGIHPTVASMHYIAERMIDQTSNASRIVDKLVDKGWVDRKVCPKDRRQVEVTITEAGLDYVEQASQVMEAGIREFEGFSEMELDTLNTSLDMIRNHLNTTI